MKTVLPQQRFALVAALIVILGSIGVAALTSVYGDEPPPPATHLGIEHLHPLTLSLSLHTSGGRWGIVDIGTISNETTLISLPDSWRRREVRNVPLYEVQADPPSFGFVRYTFPPQAIVSFIIPALPERLLLHNPSNVPIQLNLTKVNTATQTAEHTVILIQDSPKEIW